MGQATTVSFAAGAGWPGDLREQARKQVLQVQQKRFDEGKPAHITNEVIEAQIMHNLFGK